MYVARPHPAHWESMLTFFTILHVLVCVFMIFVILLQPGKEDGMGAAIGGGSGAATSAFGGRGAVTFLSKVTAVLAVIFFLTSLGLSFVGIKRSVAVGPDDAQPAAAAAPTSSLPAGAIAPSQNAQPAGGPPAGAQAPAAPSTPAK